MKKSNNKQYESIYDKLLEKEQLEELANTRAKKYYEEYDTRMKIVSKANNLNNIEETIINAAITTGRFIKENSLNIANLDWKSADDPVTNLDKESELMIRYILKKKIKANYYGEEYGIENSDAKINIYTDPIDGTKSFIRGEYLSSLSVAADKKGELFIGVVCDFMKGFTYYATSKGAFLKSEYQIVELPHINLEFSKPTISFSWNYEQKPDAKNKIFARRQAASIALSMAQLAGGSYDAMIMKPHRKNGVTDTCDIAAGYYIMKQAGIMMTDFFGKEFDYRNPHQGIIAYKDTHKMQETIDEIIKDLK